MAACGAKRTLTGCRRMSGLWVVADIEGMRRWRIFWSRYGKGRRSLPTSIHSLASILGHRYRFFFGHLNNAIYGDQHCPSGDQPPVRAARRHFNPLCVPKTLNPTIVVMKSAQDGA